MNKIFLLTSILVGLTCSSIFAQQPWRFHIAFEDGTGQRDTLWMVFDTTATNGIDYQLGEGPAQYDPNVFNVFRYNMNFDSTKVKASPYSMYPYIGTDNIFAINYNYPIIIRWDTSLFHASYLPVEPLMNWAIMAGNYAFFVLPIDLTSPYLHTINLFNKDNLFCPEDTGGPTQLELFGDLGFGFGFDPYLSISTYYAKNISIFPNPSSGQININCNEIITSYSISDISGKTEYAESFDSPRYLENYEIPHQNLTSGMYIIKLINPKNQNYYEKFIIKK